MKVRMILHDDTTDGDHARIGIIAGFFVLGLLLLGGIYLPNSYSSPPPAPINNYYITASNTSLTNFSTWNVPNKYAFVLGGMSSFSSHGDGIR